MFSVVQERIRQAGDEFGNKAANLIELDNLCQSIAAPDIQVKIPEINPLSHHQVQSHLDQYAPNWKNIYQSFVSAQGKANTLQSAAVEHLHKLQHLILNAFKMHPIEIDFGGFIQSMQNQQAVLMVRSTGKEDDITAANPGGNTSVPAVQPDPTSISTAIGVVVASYFSEKSLKQRLLSPPPANDITQVPFMPVLLQKMIGEEVHYLGQALEHEPHPEQQIICSGVMYTKDRQITVQIAPGHGELIVNSKAPFDTYYISGGDVVYPTVFKKQYRLAPVDKQGKRELIFMENPVSLQNTLSISPQKALELARIGRAIEKHYGMKMDVEFVYDPRDATFYLVQARPIPQGDRGKLMPSSFPPDKIPELKKDKNILIRKGTVISPADHAAKIIKNQSELIICDTLEAALIEYLAQENSTVKAVLVKNIAPSTSHEAAQFNAKAIPVLQVNDTQEINDWIQYPNSVLIIDPQRNQIVNWTKRVKEYHAIEQELFAENMLEYGLFRSSLPPQVTPALNLSIHQTTEVFQTAFASELNHDIPLLRASYTELERGIELLEAAKPGQKNEEAIKALLAIQFQIFCLSRQKRNDPLFKHAVIFCADLKKCLADYSNPELTSPQQLNAMREEWLDLVSKLNALIVNHGEELLLSDSIYQRAQELANAQYASNEMPESSILDKRQFVYFQEFIKLKKVILNPDIQQKWAEFVFVCCQHNVYAKRLKQLIKFITSSHIEADVLNILFPECILKNNSPKEILVTLGKECGETLSQLSSMNLNQAKMVIQGWTRRLNEWSNPDHFDKLYKEYMKEIMPLIQQLSFDAQTPRLVKKAILKTVQELADTMDITIKTMKGSPEYQTEDQKRLQVQRFIKLLEPYYELMHRWMSAIDASEYDRWERRVRKALKMNKERILDAIQDRFNQLKLQTGTEQLNPSGGFSVLSARLGSTASFYLQFVHKTLTLEDMFSFFHQNIVASTLVLSEETQIQPSQLPTELSRFVAEFSYTDHPSMQMELLGIEYHHPVISIEYNLPLRNHAAKFLFEYHREKKTVTLKANLSGNNIGGLMARSHALMEMENKFFNLLGIRTIQKPVHNLRSYNVSFSWEWDSANMELLAPLLKRAFFHYGEIPFDFSYDSKTLFHYLDEKVPYLHLIKVYEALQHHIEDKNFSDPKITECLQRLAALIKIKQRYSVEQLLEHAQEKFAECNQFLMNIDLNLTTQNIANAQQILNDGLAIAREARGSTHDVLLKNQANQLIQKISKTFEKIEHSANSLNIEASELLKFIKNQLMDHHPTRLRLFYKELVLSPNPRTSKHTTRQINRINDAEKGAISSIDVLENIAHDSLLAAELVPYFKNQKGRQLADVVRFTSLAKVTSSPNHLIIRTMNDFLHRPQAKLRNYEVHTQLAKILIKKAKSGETYQNILEYADTHYKKKKGSNKFHHMIKLLKMVCPQLDKAIAPEPREEKEEKENSHQIQCSLNHLGLFSQASTSSSSFRQNNKRLDENLQYKMKYN